MQFDFKKTTWERVTVPKEFEKKILKAIKEGNISSANDIFDICEDAACNNIIETDEQMTVEENDGCSTIEVLNEDGQTIFKNGKI